MHSNARTNTYSRALIINRVLEQGQLPALVAEAFGISERTVYKWMARYRAFGVAGLCDRTSRPLRSPAKLAEACEQAILHLRRRYHMTARMIAKSLDLAISTVARILKRHGIGKISDLVPKEKPRRYERATPGEIIHIDIKKLNRFWRAGHRVTGNRRGKCVGAGWEYVHIAIDDHSRLAYAEILTDEKAKTSAAFLIRAVRFFKKHNIKIQRIMTDNGVGYVAKYYAKIMRMLRLKHIRTKPYTPKTNGKAERFIQTLLREWAYAKPYPSSAERGRALQPFLDFYNHQREHAGIKYQTPLSRCPITEQPVEM